MTHDVPIAHGLRVALQSPSFMTGAWLLWALGRIAFPLHLDKTPCSSRLAWDGRGSYSTLASRAEFKGASGMICHASPGGDNLSLHVTSCVEKISWELSHRWHN